MGTDYNASALVSRGGDLLFAEGIGMADERWGEALDADALVDAAAMQPFITPLADITDQRASGTPTA